VDIESSSSPEKFTPNCSGAGDLEPSPQVTDPIYSEIMKVEVSNYRDGFSARSSTIIAVVS